VALSLWKCSSVCGVGVVCGLVRVLFSTDRPLLAVQRQLLSETQIISSRQNNYMLSSQNNRHSEGRTHKLYVLCSCRSYSGDYLDLDLKKVGEPSRLATQRCGRNFTGRELGDDYTTLENFMIVKFESNDAYDAFGFSVRYEFVPGKIWKLPENAKNTSNSHTKARLCPLLALPVSFNF